MTKDNFNNTLRKQCLDVRELSPVQFERSAASFKELLPEGVIRKLKRIVATGCGDSFLAAAEAKEAFARYLPDIEYETPAAIEAARYIDLMEQEPDTLVVALSVSGSAARVEEILARANQHGCTSLALTDNLQSRAARTAKYTYHTNTPVGDNVSGLRTYHVSMLSLYVMAAMMAEVRSGQSHLDELREQVAAYRDRFYEQFDLADSVCFEGALAWKRKKFFEVTADGPLFYCGKFIAAKFAELSGDVCSVIDSENYFHVNGMMYPGEHIGELTLVSSHDANADRIAAAVNAQVVRGKRDVIVFCDKKPEEIGITEQVIHCPLPVPALGYGFLLPLFAFIPGAVLASYRAAVLGEDYFRGGATMAHMTLGSNPVRVI